MLFPQLLEGLRNLDEDALRSFFTLYSPLLIAYIGRRVNRNDAEDVTQEFLYNVIKKNLFNKFAGDTEPVFNAFILRCAHNFSLNWRKKEYDPEKVPDPFDPNDLAHWKIVGAADSLHNELIRKDLSLRLNEEIERLDAQYRAVLELKLLAYSNAEIAEMLDQPLGSVNSWYVRGIHILRDRLKDLHSFSGDIGL